MFGFLSYKILLCQCMLEDVTASRKLQLDCPRFVRKGRCGSGYRANSQVLALVQVH